jgi:hypothetical protein
MVFAADARFAGMGNLEYIFEDDYHALDLYDFAGIASGFLKNDSISSTVFRTSVLRQHWEEESLTYVAIGQAIPQRLTEYGPVEAVAFYADIPEFNLVPCECIYESRQTQTEYDHFGREQKPHAYGVAVGYSILSRDFETVNGHDIVRTPSFAYVYAKPVSEKVDLGFTLDMFYGTFSSADNSDHMSLWPFGGGIGLNYNEKHVTFGVNLDYHYTSFTYKHVWEGGQYKETFGGHALSPMVGILVSMSDVKWIAAGNYKYVALGGSSGGRDLGDVNINAYNGRTQILYAPAPFRITGFGEYDHNTPVYTDEGGSTWFETAYTDVTGGAGLSVKFNQIMVGIEGTYCYHRTDDRQLEETLRSDCMAAKCGVELAPVTGFAVRAGYNYVQSDPDLDDILDVSDKLITNAITAGLGVTAMAPARIDIAYSYQWSATDVLPDERITDHVVTFYFQYGLTTSRY